MRIKFFLIYFIVGAAFLSASLWVLLSRGKSARAIRTKYRLGGVLLTVGTFLSACSCDTSGVKPTGSEEGDDDLTITCYDPVQEDIVDIGVPQDKAIHPGEMIYVMIMYPTFPEYILTVRLKDEGKTLLQESSLLIEDPAITRFEVPLLETISSRGEALVEVQGRNSGEPNSAVTLAAIDITII